MTRLCPECGCPLRKLDVNTTAGMGGVPIVQRTFECGGCGAVWLSEETIRGRHDHRWLRQNSRSRSATG